MDYEMEEREIDLKDMLYRVLLRWRAVIVGAIVIALLAGLYRFATGALSMLNPEALAESEEQYQIELADYEATGERLRTQIKNLRESSANQQEYNEKSAVMEIDPMNKWVGSFVVYVDSKYQIDPSLTYQNTDKTNRLLMAYAGYLTGGELYNEILEQTDIVDEIRFLTEILWSSVDTGSSSITVNCIGKSEADVQVILDMVKSGIRNKYTTIRNTIGDHNCDVLMESKYTTIDLALDERQKANLQAINDYAISMGETNEELTEWAKEPLPKMKYGWWYVTKQSIKFILIGGVAGVFVMCGAFAAAYVLTSTVKTESDWKLLDIPVLATVYLRQPKKLLWQIDHCLMRRLGGRNADADTAALCKLAANNIGAVLKEKGLTDGVVMGDVSAELAEDIVAKMNDAGTENRFRYVGNALSDAETVNRMDGVPEVILIGQTSQTGMEAVEKEKLLLTAWGKKVLGAIVVE